MFLSENHKEIPFSTAKLTTKHAESNLLWVIHGSGVTEVGASHLKGIRYFQGSAVLQCLQHILEVFGDSDLLKISLITLSHHMRSPSQLWQKVWRVCGVGHMKGNPLKGASSFQ